MWSWVNARVASGDACLEAGGKNLLIEFEHLGIGEPVESALSERLWNWLLGWG